MSLTRRAGGARTGGVLALSIIVSAGVFVLPGSVPSARSQEPAPTLQTGRIAYAGTDHRSLGVVADPDPSRLAGSDPLFGAGPTHFDFDPSARGDLLVFTSLRDEPTPQVYLRDGGGGVRKLTSGRSAAHPELTPDRTAVVFDSVEVSQTGTGTQHDLWVVGVDGTGLRRLTDTPADETEPTVSAENGRVAFTSPDLDPVRGREIYLMPLAGGQVVRVTDEPNGAAISPEFNPVNDAVHLERLAYTLDADANLADAGDQSVRIIECDTGATTGIPVLAGSRANWQSREAAWQPGGDLLLILSQNTPAGPPGVENRVYRLDLGAGIPTTADPRELLSEDRLTDAPAWLVDAGGPRLVTARSSAATRNVASLQDIRSDGIDPRDLGLSVLTEDPVAVTDSSKLFDPSPGFDPWTIRQAYSPDGRRIAVSRFETIDGRRVQRIWLADADGTNAAPVPVADRQAGDWETDVAWSPDGTELAIARRSPGAPNREGGPSRIVVVRADTGAVVSRLSNPDPATADQDDTQPSFSPDGTLLAFSRGTVAGGPQGQPRDQRIFLTRTGTLDQQRDITAVVCQTQCSVTDDSPAFSPDGRSLTFNRENDGLLRYSLEDNGCQVLLPRPPAAATCNVAVNAPDGPFQPRDVSYSPDGGATALSTRRTGDPNAAEGLAVFDLAAGTLRPLTIGLPGRQKEPSWQAQVNLGIAAPQAAGPVPSGTPVTIPARVVNNGPAIAPGSTVSITPGDGLRLDGLTSTRGTCDPQALRCTLGTLEPGATVDLTAQVTGTRGAMANLGWSVTSAVLDATPADNSTGTVVTVLPPPGQPAPPTTNPPPAPSPPAPNPPARRTIPPAAAEPSITLNATTNPAYVGGRTALVYRVTNAGATPATGLRVRFGLPAGIPVAALPPGCTASGCAIGDLAPGASTVLQVVLAPTAAARRLITTALETTGTDANPANNTASTELVVLQPRIVAVPPIGKPGFVTSVRGTDFPPGAPVRLTWNPGITAAAAPTLPGGDGRFAGQLLILTKDQTGPRTITATGPGFSPVTTPFLVVAGVFTPPDLVTRR